MRCLDGGLRCEGRGEAKKVSRATDEVMQTWKAL